MPARSPGANPVRQASASCGEVNQVTPVIAIPARSCASTSPINPYRTRARPVRPPPHSLAARPIRVSGMTMVTNASVRTDAPDRAWASSSLTCLARPGPFGRWWRAIHRSRSAPSSGTVRTVKRISSMSSVREASSSSCDRPAPCRRRSFASLSPIPGWTTAAVTAHVFAAWSWMSATRARACPCGGPSWIWTPASTPGRSAAARSCAFPVAAALVNRVHPVRAPTANTVEAASHPVADRPRTGATVTTSTSAHAAVNSRAGRHAPCWTAQNTGITLTARTASCHPDRPKNQPILSRL